MTTVGDMVLTLYARFLARYRDPDIAAVATAATVNEMLQEQHMGMLTREGELVIDVQTAWEIGDRCTVEGHGKGRIQAFRHPNAQVLLDVGRFIMVPYEKLAERVSLREQAMQALNDMR